ncbi:hypothetical protein AB595_20820 [Massilia sp. WF1]|uniref:hypothetical protein n=1 Tax=unclassified Massilia TaxID=2609279 RepID=UPI00064A1BFC|nr:MULTISPECIES: hypothetical protein [unclassified Massilia]ALK95538.1 hypothetical protein AM586_03725 [Massilia sp. WG5]KLU34885.1 hypothetical protein AB595_20820 [Massilia sp. WF1]
MKIAHQNIIRIATVLALTAASTSAFAQSAEYRRGYDAGYEAGLRAGRDDHGGRPGLGRLHIEEAEYGVRGAVCDARRGVRDEIERTGAVVARNQLCGDPAPGEEKRLRVVYRCGDSEPARAFAREGETLRFPCRR